MTTKNVHIIEQVGFIIHYKKEIKNRQCDIVINNEKYIYLVFLSWGIATNTLGISYMTREMRVPSYL